MREGRLEQVGHVLLDESLIANGVRRVQGHTDLTLLNQIKHVSQDRCVHRQTWRTHTPDTGYTKKKNTMSALYKQP